MRFIKDEQGTIRFEANPIVRKLLDEATARGYSLNDLALCDFPKIEWEEFYRLIGYSLTGYHELSNVTDESAIAASYQAQDEFPEAGGCRDNGCKVHSGVNYR